MCETTGFSNIVPFKHAPVTSDNLGQNSIRLRPVDSVDVTIIVDNSVDSLLISDKRATRHGLYAGWSKRPQLVAEHGYSVLFTFKRKGSTTSILYDAGLTPETIIHNLDVLGIQLKDLEAIVLSHGHVDHHGGLPGLVKKIGKTKLPLILHPDAWHNRKVKLPFGVEFELPPPDRKSLEKLDVQIVEEKGPSLLLEDELLVTGQVERTTDFEKGLRFQVAEQENGQWTPDPMVWDDQGIIVNVNGKGLVIVSSCSHSGVVNILRNAQKITGISKIYGFVGGLHLPGIFEEIIPQTVQELEKIHPDVIVPGHCSGWKATHEIAKRMPEAYVQTSVGSQIHF